MLFLSKKLFTSVYGVILVYVAIVTYWKPLAPCLAERRPHEEVGAIHDAKQGKALQEKIYSETNPLVPQEHPYSLQKCQEIGAQVAFRVCKAACPESVHDSLVWNNEERSSTSNHDENDSESTPIPRRAQQLHRYNTNETDTAANEDEEQSSFQEHGEELSNLRDNEKFSSSSTMQPSNDTLLDFPSIIDRVSCRGKCYLQALLAFPISDQSKQRTADRWPTCKSVGMANCTVTNLYDLKGFQHLNLNVCSQLYVDHSSGNITRTVLENQNATAVGLKTLSPDTSSAVAPLVGHEGGTTGTFPIRGTPTYEIEVSSREAFEPQESDPKRGAKDVAIPMYSTTHERVNSSVAAARLKSVSFQGLQREEMEKKEDTTVIPSNVVLIPLRDDVHNEQTNAAPNRPRSDVPAPRNASGGPLFRNRTNPTLDGGRATRTSASGTKRRKDGVKDSENTSVHRKTAHPLSISSTALPQVDLADTAPRGGNVKHRRASASVSEQNNDFYGHHSKRKAKLMGDRSDPAM